MSFLNLITNVLSPSRVANGQPLNQRGTRDGMAYFTNELMAYALEGRIFNAAVGTATTPATFVTAYTAAQPTLVIDVPSGTTVIPLQITCYLEASTGANNEIIMMTGTALVGAGTSTAVTPLATRTDNQIATAVNVYSLYSGNGTAPVNTREFYHSGNQQAGAAGVTPFFQWKYTDTGPQVVVGAGTIAVYVDANGNTAPTGFLRATWVELPSTSVV